MSTMTEIPCNTDAIRIHNTWRANIMGLYGRIFQDAALLVDDNLSLLAALERATKANVPDPLMRVATYRQVVGVARRAFHANTEWSYRTLNQVGQEPPDAVRRWLTKLAEACEKTHKAGAK